MFMITFLILTEFLSTISSLSNGANQKSSPVIKYHQASREHINYARRSILENLMNPLSLSEKNLLCAIDDKSGDLVGFGQIRPLDHGASGCKNYELASLFVKPEYRSLGIGSDIVRELLQRFDDCQNDSNTSLYLLTLRTTRNFYEAFGFKVLAGKDIKNIPSTLQFEVTMGNIISSVLGNQLVCMCRS